MKKIAIAFAAAASLVSTGAMAQAYVSGGVGMSRADIDCEGVATCDKNDVAVKLTGGYSLGNGFAAELGYINFGKAKLADSGVSADVKANAFTLGGAYRAELSPAFGLSARLGLARVKTKVSASVPGFGSGSLSETKTKPYVGVGVDYALAPQLKLEVGADFTRGEIQGEKADLSAVTVGLRFDF